MSSRPSGWAATQETRSGKRWRRVRDSNPWYAHTYNGLRPVFRRFPAIFPAKRTGYSLSKNREYRRPNRVSVGSKQGLGQNPVLLSLIRSIDPDSRCHRTRRVGGLNRQEPRVTIDRQCRGKAIVSSLCLAIGAAQSPRSRQFLMRSGRVPSGISHLLTGMEVGFFQLNRDLERGLRDRCECFQVTMGFCAALPIFTLTIRDWNRFRYLFSVL